MGSIDGTCIRTSSSKPIPIILSKGKSLALPPGVKAHIIARAGTYVVTRYLNFNALTSIQTLMKSGLTVGVLVASALVAGTTSKEANAVERVDHSWEDILGMSTALF
jgi:hypothetical protein